MRCQLLFVTCLAVSALLLAPLLMAQSPGVSYAPVPTLETIYTPEIHIGSATTPSTITVPPVLELSPNPPEPVVSNAPPASTALLATRHFDFIVSPLGTVVPGSMEDTSISLGDYARQLRAEKQQPTLPPTPNAMANPANSK